MAALLDIVTVAFFVSFLSWYLVNKIIPFLF